VAAHFDDLSEPQFPWFKAAQTFVNEFDRSVAWSTLEQRWYVRTFFEISMEMAWVENARFIWDLLRAEGAADFSAAVHAARMLLARDGDPAEWEPEPQLDRWRCT